MKRPEVDAFVRDVPPEVVIVANWPGEGFSLRNPEGKTLAQCMSAKALAAFAFARGADSVKHDYDLRLSEDEI